MMRILFVVLVFGGYTYALTEEELKAEFTKLVMKCLKDHPVDMTELTALQKLVIPKKPEVKCLLACAYKLDGIMNDKGLYNIEHAYKVAELAKNGDEKRLENGKKMADVCVKVNDVEVSDGEKGCERAGLMFKCAVENAPKALTEEEIKANFIKLVVQCMKDNPVEMIELVNLKQLIVPNKPEVKCLLACAYKLDGLMTDKGLYNIEHAYKVAELTKNGDDKRLENAKKMADVCVKVNDEEVSDGEKGCERARLIFKCAVENAPKFGFKIK
ncbi:uncharacterized protein LOC114366189 [Ostrinia furnacalis]|uniref:uncharacterized protein LOC114366189 n=1 Tax=Ostrinia furnacalis TaxID=93504 RepID=UPI00103B7B46|nr:uncharacterized protein LOC114366189 [Ostrinia furnacalis]